MRTLPMICESNSSPKVTSFVCREEQETREVSSTHFKHFERVGDVQ